MPILQPPAQAPFHTYNESSKGLSGIPNPVHVAVITRRNGIGIDSPKGFKQPDCFVECCATPVDPDVLPFNVQLRLNNTNGDVDVSGVPAAAEFVVRFYGRAVGEYTIAPFSLEWSDILLEPLVGSNTFTPSTSTYNFPGVTVPASEVGGYSEVESQGFTFAHNAVGPQKIEATVAIAADKLTATTGANNISSIPMAYSFRWYVD